MIQLNAKHRKILAQVKSMFRFRAQMKSCHVIGLTTDRCDLVFNEYCTSFTSRRECASVFRRHSSESNRISFLRPNTSWHSQFGCGPRVRYLHIWCPLPLKNNCRKAYISSSATTSNYSTWTTRFFFHSNHRKQSKTQLDFMPIFTYIFLQIQVDI